MRSIAPLLTALTLLAGCAEPVRTGPPQIRYGRDECVECGMSIVEEHSACAILVLDHGRRVYRLFDDMGCLLDHERERTLQTLERHAHDYATKKWLSADSARYLMSESIRTPMGSWIAAYPDAAAADAARATHPGVVLDLETLRRERVAWREKRFGKPALPAETPTSPPKPPG